MSSRTQTVGRRAARRRRTQIRRRRATALACVSLTVILVLLLASSASTSRHPSSHQTRNVARALRRHQLGSASSSKLAARENRAIDRLLARQPFISVGGAERREIALTFDDGPGPYTPRLLDQLQRLRVPATFFEIGFMFHWFHGSASRQLRMGEVIGDHTETHPMMAELPAATQESQILDQTEWVRKYGGPFPRLWRPPYGSYNANTLAILHHERMLMVLWTIDTDDYLRPGVATIVHKALSGARPGAIILMHDGGGDRTETIDALPPIVMALRERGYKLVTVPQLILDDPPQHVQHLPAGLAGD
jgi:peptidoglycan-N-acetylglucosamine deacetylase